MRLEHWLREEGITYPLVGTAILSVLMAVLLAEIGNLAVGTQRAKKIILDRHDNGFLKLFNRAALESRMVSVTLSSRKVYIGFVLSTPNLSPQEQFLGVLPVVSGYRDKDTQDLVITTNYGPALSAGILPPSDFEVTFPLASIEIASFFDPKAYPLFKGEADRPDRAAQAPRLELAPPSS